MIGVSYGDGSSQQFETDYDYAIGRPLEASTELTGALKVAGGTNTTPVDQKAIDELVAAAPNFANSPVIDQMSATAERSRPEVPITASPNPKAPGSASAAQELSDMSDVAARPTDPSVDSFIDRYGVWNIEDLKKKSIQDFKIERELNKDWKGKSIPPGTKAWPNTSNVISDASPDSVEAGQQYAMMDEDARKSGKVIRPDFGAGGSRATSGGSVPGKSGEVKQFPTEQTAQEKELYKILKDFETNSAAYKPGTITELQKGYPEAFKRAHNKVMDERIAKHQEDIKSGKLTPEGMIKNSAYEEAAAQASWEKMVEQARVELLKRKYKVDEKGVITIQPAKKPGASSIIDRLFEKD
jgi:hypothetical protein